METEASSNLGFLIGLLVVLAVIVTLFVAGIQDKIVIFFNLQDLYISAFAGFFLLWAISVAEWDAYVLNILALACCLFCFAKAIRHNRSVWLGIWIGLFKILFAAASLAAFVHEYCVAADEEVGFKRTVSAMTNMALIGIFLLALVNGPEVYAAKGWDLTGNDGC